MNMFLQHFPALITWANAVTLWQQLELFPGFSCKNNSCCKLRKSFKRDELYQQCFVERALKQQTLTAAKIYQKLWCRYRVAVLHLRNGLAIHMIPEWLSFWNDFIPSRCISLYLFTRYRNDISFPYKSILFSVRIKFSFWYEISFLYHKNWKRTFFAPVFGVLVAVTVVVA